jgi:hypothetical protein
VFPSDDKCPLLTRQRVRVGLACMASESKEHET